MTNENNAQMITLFTHDLVVVNKEPRVSHMLLAEKLGYGLADNAKHFLAFVERLSKNDPGFMSLGDVSATTEASINSNGASHERRVLHFTERQALYITAKSSKPEAAQLTLALVEVFVAWRNGTLTPAPQTLLEPQASLLDLIARAMNMGLLSKEDARQEVSKILSLVSTNANPTTTAPTGNLHSVAKVAVPTGNLSSVKNITFSDNMNLIPTKLGKLVGKEPVALNKLLEGAGLQVKMYGQWLLTEEGAKYARHHTYMYKGERIMNILWCTNVLKVLDLA